MTAGGLNEAVQGDGPCQRDEHKIKCLSLFIKGYIAFPEEAGDQVREMPKVSIALVQDSQANGVTINSEDSKHYDNSTVSGHKR